MEVVAGDPPCPAAFDLGSGACPIATYRDKLSFESDFVYIWKSVDSLSSVAVIPASVALIAADSRGKGRWPTLPAVAIVQFSRPDRSSRTEQ
jgi:hypothetical protein